MTHPPRIAYARRSTDPTRVHVPSTKLPVVIVPDIMGTRLCDEDDLAWNPRGFPFQGSPHASPGPFRIDVDRLAITSAPLEPDEKHRFDRKSQRDEVRHITNYYNLVSEWYHELATSIADMNTETTRRYRVSTRVYCCGYDWRLDNARSALRLAMVIDQALRDTGAEKAIIVAHGMGGVIARYYCRCLGGEARVLRTVLVGAGSLGLPDAYSQLKHGLGGLYAKEYRNAIERLATQHEGSAWDNGGRELTMQGVGDALDLIDAAVGAADGGSFAERFFGGLYYKLCLGSGKMLSRNETRDWVRQMPAMYQLMPNATYCRMHHNWLCFDPSATGYAPTGYMLLTPTVVELMGFAVPLATHTASTFDQAIAQVGNALEGGGDARTSTRAMRNADTLVSFFTNVFTDLFGDDDEKVTDATNRLMGFGKRVMAIFIDCRSPKTLYGDIFTGLLDEVAQRVPAAGNLALARRFDDALTQNPREEPPASGKTLFKFALKAIGNLISPRMAPDRVRELQGAATSPLSDKDRADLDSLDRQNAGDEDDEEKNKRPKVYMHPNTVVISCATMRCPHPGILLPTMELSNDDSNVVLWRLIPNFVPLMGDGAVPADSAAPPDEWLTRPIPDARRHTVSGVEHRDLCTNTQVINFVKASIDEVLAELIGDASAQEPPPPAPAEEHP